MKINKVTLAVLVIIGLLAIGMGGCAAPAPAPAPAPEEILQLNFGGTTSTAGGYAWLVAQTRIINKYVPRVNVTLIESGSTYDNLRHIAREIFDLGLGSHAACYELYNGVGTFEGQPYKNIRSGWVREPNRQRWFAALDTGITQASGLASKKFGSGIPGSSNHQGVLQINELLGLNMNLYEASLSVAIQAMREGRLDGLAQSSPTDLYNAALIELNIARPIRPVGFTKEEADIVNAKYGFFPLILTPLGTVKPFPEFEGYERSNWGTVFLSTDIPEDVVYESIKAILEHDDVIRAAYPPSARWHCLKDYWGSVPEDIAVPAHPGVIKYAKEVGIDIPEAWLPPEYE